jgi:NADPH:quinone reductase
MRTASVPIMKEAIVTAGPSVKIIDSPIPTAASNQVLIKVMVSGSNPKDWKRPEWFQTPHNSGDDIAGTVEAVGEDIVDFRVGDRVAALHEMMAPGGSYAEYALAPGTACFHLPKNISFQEVYIISLHYLNSKLMDISGCNNPACRHDRCPRFVQTNGSAATLATSN